MEESDSSKVRKAPLFDEGTSADLAVAITAEPVENSRKKELVLEG